MLTFYARIEIDPKTSPDLKHWTPDVLRFRIERALEPGVDATVTVIDDSYVAADATLDDYFVAADDA